PNVAQPRAVARERGIGRLLLQRVVVEAVQLEREEQQLGRGRVDLLLRGLKKPRDLRVGEVPGASQLGIAGDAAADLLERLVFGDRRAQRRAIESGKPAAIAGLEGVRRCLERLQIGGQLRAVAAGIEVAQVPFGQSAQRVAFGSNHRSLALPIWLSYGVAPPIRETRWIIRVAAACPRCSSTRRRGRAIARFCGPSTAANTRR